MYALKKADVTGPRFFDQIMDVFRASIPLNRFIQRAMGMEQ